MIKLTNLFIYLSLLILFISANQYLINIFLVEFNIYIINAIIMIVLKIYTYRNIFDKIFKNKNILVTGGSGYFGSILVDLLNNYQANVSVFDINKLKTKM